MIDHLKNKWDHSSSWFSWKSRTHFYLNYTSKTVFNNIKADVALVYAHDATETPSEVKASRSPLYKETLAIIKAGLLLTCTSYLLNFSRILLNKLLKTTKLRLFYSYISFIHLVAFLPNHIWKQSPYIKYKVFEPGPELNIELFFWNQIFRR